MAGKKINELVQANAVADNDLFEAVKNLVSMNFRLS